MRKKLAATLSVVLILGLAVLGILAYLTSEDSDVNVMTLGNVKIEQHEYERVTDENGDFKTVDTSHVDPNYGYNQAYELQPFTQEKPAYPAVYTNGTTAWDEFQQLWEQVGAPGSNDLFDDSMKNVIDKFVFVENTGRTDAYYRTIVAIELPEGLTEDALHTSFNANTRFDYNVDKEGIQNSSDSNKIYVTIDGTRFLVYTATYTEVLKPGEVSRPSLLQLFLDPAVTNEDCAKFGDTWEVRVLSQAVQTEGFENAQTALKTAYGDVTEVNVIEWFTGMKPEVKVDGDDKAAVVDAINEAPAGGVVALTEDTTVAGYAATEKLVIDKDITLDLNGKTLTTECGWGGIDLKGGASIINGTINHTGNTAAIKAFQVDKIENVTIKVTETAGKTKGGIVVQQGDGCYVGSIKDVTIIGATNGIECYRSTNAQAIGSMDNVKIDATANGIYLNGAGRIGKISNCEIKGGNIGINAYLANLWHISLNIENSIITGGTTGIDIWDEAAANTGSTVAFNYDNATVFYGDSNNIKVTLQGEITCTINGAAQATPCDVRE